MLDKIWNNKLYGIPSTFFILFIVLLKRVRIKFLSFWFSSSFYSVGKNVIFYPGLVFRYPKNITIGSNCIFNENVSFGSELDVGKLFIGDNVSISSNVKLDFSGDLRIGSNVTISDGVKIFTHDHGLDPRSIPVGKSLVIQDNVWIGANAIILQNVNKIGRNSIIASGAVVTKDIPNDSVVAGNPAKTIKNLKI
ncbi:acyltransferase [Algoriphagus formosus]|uniref:acyltransferase n=1 Tax=Algoriphagus formosus TaxID=2007308 RepID=UPI003F6E5CC6